MQQLFRQPAHQVFQGRGDDDGACIEDQQVLLQRHQQQQNKGHAQTIDGADRPQEKAPVDKFSGFDGGEDDLRTPAQEGVEEENPEQLIE